MTPWLLGVLLRPHSTMIQIAAAPRWAAPWLSVVTLLMLCAVPFLRSPVGRQALVDERVRRVEAFGGSVDADRYAAWQQHPPISAYFVSGGRLLLAPPVTLAVAIGLLIWARRSTPTASLTQTLAVSVYASVPLALGHAIATPLQYLRESLASPFNLAALLRLTDEGTWVARLLGSVELFGLWWAGLLALGLGAITMRPARHYLAWLVVIYLVVAALVVVTMMLLGGA